MNTKELRKLALFGLTAGLMTINLSGLSASEDPTDIDVEHMIARPKCNDGGNCGSLTAMRSKQNLPLPIDDDLGADEEDSENYEE